MAKVNRIVDGDTIKVTHKTDTVTVRLWGIDTPEWKQPYAKFAKKTVHKLVQGKIVEIVPKGWDDFGRQVALVTENGSSVNEELIISGAAWVHIYYCNQKICEQWKKMESNARKKKKGLWQSNDPIPPWVWKRKNK